MEVRENIPQEGRPAGAGPGNEGMDLNGADRGDEELSRRERERLVRRGLMLEAARAVFAEKGYADATLDEIAQRAEFGKGTLYNYFEGGKEEILYAVFDDLYDDLDQLIERTFHPSLVEEHPFRDLFEGFLTALFAFFVERQDQFMIMIKEGHRLSLNEEPDKASYFMNRGEEMVQALIPTIEAAEKKGVLRNLPATSVAHMILGNVKGYHMHKYMAGCREALSKDFDMPAPEASAKFLSNFLLDGILAQDYDASQPKTS